MFVAGRRSLLLDALKKERAMSQLSVSRIENNPKYRELVKARDALAWSLTVLVLIIYFGFILLVAFAPGFLTQPISANSVIPVGIPVGVGVILASVILTGIYVRRANSTFDPLIRQIIQEASK
jgi:uncharacterized membrane protein (DUF485 family)